MLFLAGVSGKVVRWCEQPKNVFRKDWNISGPLKKLDTGNKWGVSVLPLTRRSISVRITTSSSAFVGKYSGQISQPVRLGSKRLGHRAVMKTPSLNGDLVMEIGIFRFARYPIKGKTKSFRGEFRSRAQRMRRNSFWLSTTHRKLCFSESSRKRRLRPIRGSYPAGGLW